MSTLLIVKVVIPFFVVSSVFGVLTTLLDLSPFSLFLVVAAMMDLPTMHFFYLVSDRGSWLDIGTHISHFCIAELFTIFITVLFFLSQWLVGHLSSSSLQSSHYLQLQY
jgi:phosphatidylinositol glycan class N